MNFCLPPLGAVSSPIITHAETLKADIAPANQKISGRGKSKLQLLILAEEQSKFHQRRQDLFCFEESTRALLKSEWWTEVQMMVFEFFNDDALLMPIETPEVTLPLMPTESNFASPVEYSADFHVARRADELFDLETLQRRREAHESSKKDLRQLVEERNASQDRIFDTASCAVKSVLIPTRPVSVHAPVKGKSRQHGKTSRSCLPGIVMPWDLVLAERTCRNEQKVTEQSERLTIMYFRCVVLDCILPFRQLHLDMAALHHWPTDYRLSRLVLVQRWWRWVLDAPPRRRLLVQVRKDVRMLREMDPPSKRWGARLDRMTKKKTVESGALRLELSSRICFSNVFREFVSALGCRVDAFIREKYTAISKQMKQDAFGEEIVGRRLLEGNEQQALRIILEHERKMRLCLSSLPDEENHEVRPAELWPAHTFPEKTTSRSEWEVVRSCEVHSISQRVKEIIFDAPRRRRNFNAILDRFALHGCRLGLFNTRLAEQERREHVTANWTKSLSLLVSYHHLMKNGGPQWAVFVRASQVVQEEEARCRQSVVLESEHVIANLQREMEHSGARLVLLNDSSATFICLLEQSIRLTILQSEEESLQELKKSKWLIDLMLRATRSLQQAGLIESNFTTGRKLWARAMKVIKRRVSSVNCVENLSRRTNFSEVVRVVAVLQRWWRARNNLSFADVSKKVLRHIRHERVRSAAAAHYFKQIHGVNSKISEAQLLLRTGAACAGDVRTFAKWESERRTLLQNLELRHCQEALIPFFVVHILCTPAQINHLTQSVEPDKRESIAHEWITGLANFRAQWQIVQRDRFAVKELCHRREIAAQQEREWIHVDAQGFEMRTLLETIAAHSPPPEPTIAEVVNKMQNVRGLRNGFVPSHNQRETTVVAQTIRSETMNVWQRIACRESVTRTRIEHDAFYGMRQSCAHVLFCEAKSKSASLEEDYLADLGSLAEALDSEYPLQAPLSQLKLLSVKEARLRHRLYLADVTVKRAEMLLMAHAGIARILWLQFLKSVAHFRSEADYFYKHWSELLQRRVKCVHSKTQELEKVEAAHRCSIEFFEDLSLIALMNDS